VGLKVDLNVQDNQGDTALHIAARSEFVPVIEFLLAGEARTDIKNSKGMTAQELTSSPMVSSLFESKGE